MKDHAENIRKLIRNIPDFPEKGIVFRDITPLALTPGALGDCAKQLIDEFDGAKIDLVAGIESRGFIIGTAVAMELGVGLALVRKKGKLPYQTLSETYSLEYGSDSIEMHTDAVKEGERILLIDDLLATGGTAAATCRLIERLGGTVVGCGFIIELDFLEGRNLLENRKIVSLLHYETE